MSNFRNWLTAEIEQVLKAMDNSKDTSAALGEIMLRVYTAGVRKGATDGYGVGFTDGKRDGATARASVAADGLVRRHAADAARELQPRTGTGG